MEYEYFQDEYDREDMEEDYGYRYLENHMALVLARIKEEQSEEEDEFSEEENLPEVQNDQTAEDSGYESVDEEELNND